MFNSENHGGENKEKGKTIVEMGVGEIERELTDIKAWIKDNLIVLIINRVYFIGIRV